MAQLRVNVRKPEGTEVRIVLNGQRTDVIDVPKHSMVHIEVRQVREATEDEMKHLFRKYLISLLAHGKVVYGNVIPNPFFATYEADIMLEDDFFLTLDLAACGGHYELFCDEELAFIKGSVRKKEENLHKKVWFFVMLFFALPIFLLILLALLSIWNGDVGQKGEIPLYAAIGFSAVFLAGGAFVIWQMIRRLR